MIISRSHPFCCKWNYCICFSGWVIFHYIYVPSFLSAPLLMNISMFIISMLLPCLGYYKQHCTVAQLVKNLPDNAGDARDMSLIPGSGISPEGENTPCSSILAWRIPLTKEPWHPTVPGSQRVGHDWTYTQACSEHWSACTTQIMFAVILFFLYICPGVGLLDHMVALVSVFKGIFLLFSIVAVPIYNSTKRKESFLCSTPSPAFIVYRLFDDHSDYTLL